MNKTVIVGVIAALGIGMGVGFTLGVSATWAVAYEQGHDMGYHDGSAAGWEAGRTEIDWAARSSYYQGRYEQCMVDGYQETVCYSTMQTLMAQESTP